MRKKKGVKLENFHNIVYSYSFKFLNFYLIQAYDFPDYMFGLLWYKQQTNVKLASLLDKKVFDRKILEIPVVCLIPL